jgi:hypothetical protein
MSRAASTMNHAGSAPPSSPSAITSCAISNEISANSTSSAFARNANRVAAGDAKRFSAGSSFTSRARKVSARKKRRSRSDGSAGQRASPFTIASKSNACRAALR